jgi:putative transposase
MKRQCTRPRLRRADRLFWVWLSGIWPNWRTALRLVRPETVVGWHRQGFRLFWTWVSRREKAGRPGVSRPVRDLIHQMAEANPLWGAPRIHGELLKLGIELSERTVSRLISRRRKPPSQTWRVFLDNHLQDLVSIDFFTVPTASFRVLFVFVVLAHHRRRVVHFNVTEHPTAAWTAQQILEAFPEDTAPRYLIRDRDQIYGECFRHRLRDLGTSEVLTAPQSPWQNPSAERLVGSIRRECLDHVMDRAADYSGYHRCATISDNASLSSPSGPDPYLRCIKTAGGRRAPIHDQACRRFALLGTCQLDGLSSRRSLLVDGGRPILFPS